MKPIFHVVQTGNFTALESEISDEMESIKLLNAVLGGGGEGKAVIDAQGKAGQGSEKPDGALGLPVPCRRELD